MSIQAEQQRIIAESMSEEELTNRIRGLAAEHGWLLHHDRPSRRQDGTWSTAIQGDKGFPDIVAAKRFPDGHAIILIAELKSQTGALNSEQQAWMSVLMLFNELRDERCEVIVRQAWRPSDLAEIEAIISGPVLAGRKEQNRA